MRRNPSWTISIILVLFALSTLGATLRIDVAVEKAAIRKVVDASIGWAMNKDLKLLYDSVAQDEEFFIYHPDSKSTIIGFEAFKKLAETTWMTDEFKATRYEFRDVRIRLSRTGENAWFSAVLDDCGEFRGKPGCWQDARYTGVLEKRDGKWVICQMHFSFASDKVEANARKAAKAMP